MHYRFSVKTCTFLLPSLLIWPSLASAAIAPAPLFVNTSVKPNIFFMVDDSGSMDWEVLKSDGARSVYTNTSSYPDSGDLDITPTRNDRDEILESCAGYNVLYYDPNETYIPWKGKDVNGNTYVDQSITSARRDPYYPASGSVNLTSDEGFGDPPGYMVWNDDGDGVFEIDECPDPGRTGYDYYNQFVATAGSATAQVMTAAERTNFANWYTYYRKREYVMKAAMLNIVDNSTVRLGFSTLHRNGGNGFPVADVTVGSNKANLQAAISAINSNDGTPLRTKLAQTGAYFEGTNSSSLFGSSKSSPILSYANGGSCQQNFAVVMSDGYWNGSNPNVGNADSGSTSGGDWNDTDFDGGVYADQNSGRSNTLADVAMHYYERDLDTSLPNEVPTSPLDANNQQHLVTYTVAFGVNGSLTANPTSTDTSFNWPNVSSNTTSTVDDMRHAAWNGRGDFLSADSPASLIQAFNNAIASISGRTSSASSVATNSTLLQTNSKIYQARFTTTEWTGEILAYNLDATTGDVSTVAAWNAADLLPAESERKIYMSTGTTDSGVEFTWSSASSALSSVGLAESDVQYLRGSQANEGSIYRSRSSLFGDVVNSDPVYSGSDNFGYYALETASGLATYDDYLVGSSATEKGNRTGMIYFGANDGMLHGLLGEGDVSATCNTSTQDCEGEEVFAYVPKAVHSNLIDLTSPSYTHKYFVDNTVAIGDAYINFDGVASDSTGRWGTALVGTLGAGGKGVFALDVSDPMNFTASDILWDIDSTDTDFADLGYTFAKASIVKLNDDNGTNNNDWGVVLGNGYNSTNGKAVLYIIGLRTGEIIWKKEVETTGNNGLSTPIAVDTDNDSIADAVYAGDLKGNMWAFDISDASVANWEVAKSHDNSGTTVYDPLFTACTADPCTISNRQAITSKPQVVKASSGGVLVLFGTGKYFEIGDNTDVSQTQSFYSILDDGSSTAVSGRNALQVQTIMDEVPMAETGFDSNIRITSANQIDYESDMGWYLDLYYDENSNSVNDHPGERVVADPLVRNGRVIFPTLIPETSPCSFGGTSYLMELNAQSGARWNAPLFDLNGDGNIDANDLVGMEVTDADGNTITIRVAASGKQSNVGIIKTPGIITTGSKQLIYASGSSGDQEKGVGLGDETIGRQSWIQIK